MFWKPLISSIINSYIFFIAKNKYLLLAISYIFNMFVARNNFHLTYDRSQRRTSRTTADC